MQSDPTIHPTILAFDTSAAHCAAALVCGDRIAATRSEGMARGQAERLMDLLHDVLEAGGCGWRDLAAVAVGTGPGNFTGLRIAVAAARGLALGLGIPAVGVSAFEIRLEQARHDAAGRDVVVLPAPRGGLYLQAVAEGRSIGPPQHAARDDAIDWAALGLPPGTTLPPARAPDPTTMAPSIARIAAVRLAGDAPIPRPSPQYVRAPDAAPARTAPPALIP